MPSRHFHYRSATFWRNAPAAIADLRHDAGDHFPDHGHQNHVSFSYPLFGTYPARLASKRLQIVRDRFKQDLGETLGDGGAHLLKCVGI